MGRQHRYCQADGSWSPRILPECARKSLLGMPHRNNLRCIVLAAIQCELPHNPLNGRAVYSSVSYNSLISYECNYGYMLIGDSVRRCERNKQWTGTEPHCKGNGHTQTYVRAVIQWCAYPLAQRSTAVLPASYPMVGSRAAAQPCTPSSRFVARRA